MAKTEGSGGTEEDSGSGFASRTLCFNAERASRVKLCGGIQALKACILCAESTGYLSEGECFGLSVAASIASSSAKVVFGTQYLVHDSVGGAFRGGARDE